MGPSVLVISYSRDRRITDEPTSARMYDRYLLNGLQLTTSCNGLESVITHSSPAPLLHASR